MAKTYKQRLLPTYNLNDLKTSVGADGRSYLEPLQLRFFLEPILFFSFWTGSRERYDIQSSFITKAQDDHFLSRFTTFAVLILSFFLVLRGLSCLTCPSYVLCRMVRMTKQGQSYVSSLQMASRFLCTDILQMRIGCLHLRIAFFSCAGFCCHSNTLAGHSTSLVLYSRNTRICFL